MTAKQYLPNAQGDLYWIRYIMNCSYAYVYVKGLCYITKYSFIASAFSFELANIFKWSNTTQFLAL